jgi:pyruvate/2-oxoglutarate dehydrogenase complex dihydrolipoamide dehydrogenase (E3) component
MSKHQYDSIIIGTGQATGTMVPALLEIGQRLAVIEKDRVGGTCVNWGCTPTKTIVASARAAHMARRGADFGIQLDGIAVDFARVMARQNEIRQGNSKGLESYLRESTDLCLGTARFINDREVAVGDDTLSADRIYIHTGARARIPAVPGIDSVPYLDNRRILDLEVLPEHLVVIGGSYIGLEFSQAFLRLGSRVTLLQRGPRIMSREDEDVALEAERLLREQGLNILCNSTIVSVGKRNAGVSVTIERNGETSTLEGSHLLLATGRVPNTEELNLAAAGVMTNRRGFIEVNEVLQTNIPHIYAVGDVNGLGAFTHTSVNDGQIIVRNLQGENWKVADRIQVYAMFIDPPLGRVGMNENQARSSGRTVVKGEMPMSRVSRAREKDETGGMIKVLVDADTKEILGATILGVGGDEIVNLFAAWMVTGLPYTDLQRAVLVHPTVAELLPWVFADLKPLET